MIQLNTSNGYKNYNDLNSDLLEIEVELNKKQQSSYWLRYIIRRSSLLAFIMLSAFLIPLALSISTKQPLNKFNEVIHGTFLFQTGFRNELLWIALSFLALFTLTTSTIEWEPKKTIMKPIILIALSLIAFPLCFIVMEKQHAIQLGVIVFSTLSISMYLVDKTLGFTKKNERYQVYASKIRNQTILNNSRGKLNIAFNESHILEALELIDNYHKSKYDDTVSDSFFVLNKISNVK
ncbi:hypothetical protein GL272_21245 [Aeromonas veronii]|uniref:antiviral RADAR system accessory protein RdrD n=1 Tax=Aeromonas veronii TaxID=654 RepID=UPI001C5ABF1F|nr:antiviral RADAR system accessory protein RdrD [Aeromonas veronii]MBW3779400.1 hypothetical protein [Aeromonas veronii]